MTADEIFRELIDIRRRLDALAADDPERVELEVRRGQLHELARSLDPDRPDRLERKTRDVARRVDEIEKMRLDGANMAGLVGVGGGMDPEILKFVNDSIERNHDLDSLRAELRALREESPEPDDGSA